MTSPSSPSSLLLTKSECGAANANQQRRPRALCSFRHMRMTGCCPSLSRVDSRLRTALNSSMGERKKGHSTFHEGNIRGRESLFGERVHAENSGSGMTMDLLVRDQATFLTSTSRYSPTVAEVATRFSPLTRSAVSDHQDISLYVAG